MTVSFSPLASKNCTCADTEHSMASGEPLTEETLAILGHEIRKVVFLDLQMHGISGYDVARQIRNRVELNSLVLIALTGNADAASRKLAAESGFDHYLVKPTSIAVLTETLLRLGVPSDC